MAGIVILQQMTSRVGLGASPWAPWAIFSCASAVMFSIGCVLQSQSLKANAQQAVAGRRPAHRQPMNMFGVGCVSKSLFMQVAMLAYAPVALTALHAVVVVTIHTALVPSSSYDLVAAVAVAVVFFVILLAGWNDLPTSVLEPIALRRSIIVIAICMTFAILFLTLALDPTSTSCAGQRRLTRRRRAVLHRMLCGVAVGALTGVGCVLGVTALSSLVNGSLAHTQVIVAALSTILFMATALIVMNHSIDLYGGASIVQIGSLAGMSSALPIHAMLTPSSSSVPAVVLAVVLLVATTVTLAADSVRPVPSPTRTLYPAFPADGLPLTRFRVHSCGRHATTTVERYRSVCQTGTAVVQLLLIHARNTGQYTRSAAEPPRRLELHAEPSRRLELQTEPSQRLELQAEPSRRLPNCKRNLRGASNCKRNRRGAPSNCQRNRQGSAKRFAAEKRLMAAWAKALLVMAGTVGGGALGFYWQDHIMREHRVTTTAAVFVGLTGNRGASCNRRRCGSGGWR